jgi:hypothetical protein
VLTTAAGIGWLLAVVVAGSYWRHTRWHGCLVDPPTRVILLSKSGVPESVRALHGTPPPTYSRPRGRHAAAIYARVGTAVIYQTDAE